MATHVGSVSRAVGFALVGLATGVGMGLVESALKDRWLYVVSGPLAGKQFILYKSQTTIGSKQDSDIYLFKDASILPRHAVISLSGARVMLQATGPVLWAGQQVNSFRWSHDDDMHRQVLFDLQLIEPIEPGHERSVVDYHLATDPLGPAANELVDPTVLEKIRERKDPGARASLETAYAKEDDETTKGRIKAAILEIDNPGKCVVEDEGRGEDGICRYVCRDQNSRSRYPKDPKVKGPCPLVHEPDANATKAPVNSAALSK